MQQPAELVVQCLEWIGGAAAVLDEAGTVVFANRAWNELAGAPADVGQAGPWNVVRRVFARHADLPAIEAGLRRVADGQSGSFSFEDNCASGAAGAARLAGGQAVHAAGCRWTMIRLDVDPTERSLAAHRNAPPHSRADRMGDGAEHDLRNALNAVIGFAQLLTSGIAGPLNEKQAQYANLILRQGQQALERIKVLLAARPSSGCQE